MKEDETQSRARSSSIKHTKVSGLNNKQVEFQLEETKESKKKKKSARARSGSMASKNSDDFKPGSYGTNSSGKIRKLGNDIMGLDIRSVNQQLDKHIALTRFQYRQAALKQKRSQKSQKSDSEYSEDMASKDQLKNKLRQGARRDKGTTGGFGFIPSETESQEAFHFKK